MKNVKAFETFLLEADEEKYIRTFESYVFGLNENKRDNRTVILLDGTSSSGKSFTLDSIGAVHFYEKPSPNDFEIIAIDDFVGDEEMNDPNSAHNQRRWELEKAAGISQEARDWAKETGNYGCCVKDFLGVMKQATADRENELARLKSGGGTPEEIKDQEKNIADNKKMIGEMPDADDHKDFIAGVDPRIWYMFQQYKKSKSNKIVFDDVQPNIIDYIPDLDAVILLYAPLPILVENLKRRESKDPRDPLYVFEDFLAKYVATKEKPQATEGDPGRTITKEELVKLLKNSTKDGGFSISTIDDKYIEDYPKNLGITDDGTYFIRVKDEYLKKYKPIIVIVDDARKQYLSDFKQAVQKIENAKNA